MRQAIAFGVAVLILPVAFYVVVLDQWAGLSTSFAFNAGVLGLATAISLTAHVVARKRAYWLILVAIALLLVFVRTVDLSPVKPALRGIALIKPGMTEADVRRVFELQFPVHGRFQRPVMGPLQSGTLSFVLDPNDGRYNAALVEVHFQNGLSTSARFLPD